MPLGASEASVAQSLLDRLGLGPGNAVALGNGDHTAWAVARAHDDGEQTVRLGRMLWPQLAVRPGEPVSVEAVGELPEAETARITPPYNLTFNLHQKLLERLRDDAIPLYPGNRALAEIYPGGAGMLVRIDLATPSPSRMADTTEVELHRADVSVSERVITLADVGGCDTIIRRLRELVELPLLRPAFYRRLGVRPPKGVLLHGPPGTGKTLICKALANELGVTAYRMSATELVGSVQGETEANLRLLFSRALAHAPSLVMIDEFDVIATNRERLASQSDVRAASQLLTLMDGLEEVDGLILMGTTNRIQAIDPAFRRPGRFEEEIFVGPPNEAARRGRPSRDPVHPHPGDAAERRGAPGNRRRGPGRGRIRGRRPDASGPLSRTRGGQPVGQRPRGLRAGRQPRRRQHLGGASRFAGSAAHRAPQRAAGRGHPHGADHLAPYRGPERGEGTPAGAGHTGGQHNRSNRGLRAGSRTGCAGARAVRLGQECPGARAGHRTGRHFVAIEGSKVYNQWLGESEEAVRALFRRAAEARPSLVMLDHLDALAPVRAGESGERTDERVVSALLASLDDVLAGGQVFVVGVSNRPELIDPAALRSGRLGVHLEVPNPSEARRVAMIGTLTEAHGLKLDAEVAAELAESTEGWSAADLVMLVSEAASRAAREDRPVLFDDLADALPSLTRL